MNVGFIGTGSMGSLLVQAFLASGSLRPEQVWVTNRTPAKAHALSERFPGLRVTPNAEQVADACDRVFLCVKPLEYRDVLARIANRLRPEQWLISITSPVSVADLEALLAAKVVKVIPSITNGALSGALLVVRGSRFSDAEHRELLGWLRAIGRPWKSMNGGRASPPISPAAGPRSSATSCRRWPKRRCGKRDCPRRWPRNW